MKRNIIIGILLTALVTLIIGCTSNITEESQTPAPNEDVKVETETFEQTTSPLITSEEAKTIRISTYNDCQEFIDKTITFKGTVMYSECGKNCLGGCPNTGPAYCFYGIQDDNGCMVFIKNKIAAWTTPSGFKAPDKYANKYQYGDSVEITDKISLYTNHYCNLGNDDSKIPGCSYFILGNMNFN